MQSGIYLLDKAPGLSSAAELNRLKKKLKLLKVGHAGTLDPMATGLLICLTNSATRLASFAEKGRKIYSGRIRFGLVTDTDDITGNLIEESKLIPDFAGITEAAKKFEGEIEQYPPSVSAVKIGGERAYKIARRGEVPEIKPRQVTIHSIILSEYSDSEVNFRVECNSGTYIRSIARDLGKMLGCGGTLSALRREYSSPFDVRSAKKIEHIESGDILSWTQLFPDMERISLESVDAQKLSNGDVRVVASRLDSIIKEQIPADRILQNSGKIIYSGLDRDRPLGILANNDGRWEIAVNLH